MTGDLAVLSGPLPSGEGWALAYRPASLNSVLPWHCGHAVLTEGEARVRQLLDAWPVQLPDDVPSLGA